MADNVKLVIGLLMFLLCAMVTPTWVFMLSFDLFLAVFFFALWLHLAFMSCIIITDAKS